MFALVFWLFVAPITRVGELVAEDEDVLEGLDVMNWLVAELTDVLAIVIWLCAVAVELRVDVETAIVFWAVDVGVMEDELEETAQALPKSTFGVSSDAKITYPH